MSCFEVNYRSGIRPLNLHMSIYATFFLLAACDLCSDTIVESKSNGFEMYAVLYERNCGATTPYTYYLAIHRNGERITDKNTVFASREFPRNFDWTTSATLTIDALNNNVSLHKPILNNFIILISDR